MSPLRLACGPARADVSPRGAELRRWRVGDTELIWEPDPAIWTETAPVLFPVVGWTRGGAVRVDGVSHPLGLHGFARAIAFAVVEHAPARLRLRAEADAATRALYPFAWWLEVDYALDAASLAVRLTVGNAGGRAMPYACGLHPGLRWPFAGGAAGEYDILFDEAEVPSVPVIAADGLFTRETRPVPLDGRRLPLSPELMAREALCFLDARSRGLGFRHRGGAALRVKLDGFPHIALWSRPPGRFLSIEAWTGHGDPVDADGDLHAKPSMRHLAPGATGTHAARFTFRPAPG